MRIETLENLKNVLKTVSRFPQEKYPWEVSDFSAILQRFLNKKKKMSERVSFSKRQLVFEKNVEKNVFFFNNTEKK